jgi:signal transduction histidine kinase
MFGTVQRTHGSLVSMRVEPDTAEVREHDMQQAAQSSVSQLGALRRFGEGIGIFWRVVCYTGMALAVLSILVTSPGFYAAPRGWVALFLAACYLVVFTRGSCWIAGESVGTYWKLRFDQGRVLHPWRAVALWAALLALSVTLIALNDNFVWLIWVPFGMSFSLLPMPRCLALVIPTLLLALGYYHALPTSLSPSALLQFAGLLLGLACYSAIIYMPMALLRGRFQRERMFLELQQSHHALEEAHRQLEQAAEQERELAVLRERSRLARDMHDTLGHSLALMTVKLEAAQRLRAVDPARADHEVAATQSIARDALAELRTAITDLRTRGNAHESLGCMLVGAAQEIAARTGWQLTCEIAPDVEPVGERAYEALLRTGVEALANIERHAEARAVHLTLARQGEIILLHIEDDGKGVLSTNPPQRVGVSVPGGEEHDHRASAGEEARRDTIISPPGHFGITGMRERTTGAGGAFIIGAGADGHGTRVEVRLPASDE